METRQLFHCKEWRCWSLEEEEGPRSKESVQVTEEQKVFLCFFEFLGFLASYYGL